MRMSNWMKKIKKQLRSRKRSISLAAFLLLLGVSWSGGGVWAEPAYSEPGPVGTKALEEIARDDLARQAVLRRIYVCGEETVVLGSLTRRELLEYAARHPAYVPALQPDGTAVFTETVQDLSPDCKLNAFFGIDADGNLSLFSGLPEEKRVIRTFFQLNVEDVLSSLPREAWDQLHSGIPVRDLEEYNSVLSTFSDFAAGA